MKAPIDPAKIDHDGYCRHCGGRGYFIDRHADGTTGSCTCIWCGGKGHFSGGAKQ